MPEHAADIASWPARQSTDGIMRDIIDGNVVRSFINRDPRYRQESRNRMFNLFMDPFQLFKDDSNNSACPFLIMDINTSPAFRFKLGIGCHMLAIAKGSLRAGQKKSQYDHVLDLICDELNWVDQVGYLAKDARFPEAPEVRLFAKLVFVLSDLRGLIGIFNMGGTPSTHGCLKCWIKRTCKANIKGKMIYNNHFRLLPRNHPLRQHLCRLHNGSIPPESGVCRQAQAPSILRYRSHQEIHERCRVLPAEPILAEGEQVSSCCRGT